MSTFTNTTKNIAVLSVNSKTAISPSNRRKSGSSWKYGSASYTYGITSNEVGIVRYGAVGYSSAYTGVTKN